MKHILYEVCNCLAFIVFLIAMYFIWIGFDDSDIINLKSAISINLLSFLGG